MSENSAKQQIEEAIEFVLSKGIVLTKPKWVYYSFKNKKELAVKQGASFVTRGGNKETHGISACCGLGALMYHDYVTKSSFLPEEEKKKPFVSGGWIKPQQILGVDYNWAIGFSSGWDSVDTAGKTEIDDYLRSIYTAEAYDLGIELREKYVK